MFKRTAASFFTAVFLIGIICAVVCPETIAAPAAHACDDESCCERHEPQTFCADCISTHFLSSEKYEPAGPEIEAIPVELVPAVPPEFLNYIHVGFPDSFVIHSRDILSRHHVLRI